jgi:hypothetical protein
VGVCVCGEEGGEVIILNYRSPWGYACGGSLYTVRAGRLDLSDLCIVETCLLIYNVSSCICYIFGDWRHHTKT